MNVGVMGASEEWVTTTLEESKIGMASRPRVTVLANIFNEEEFLPSFLESLAGQTYKDYLLLVVDDGSTDRGLEVVHSYAGRIPTKIVSLPHSGLRPARVEGFKGVDTELCAMLDVDQVLEPDCLEKRIGILDQDAKIAWVGGRDSH